MYFNKLETTLGNNYYACGSQLFAPNNQGRRARSQSQGGNMPAGGAVNFGSFGMTSAGPGAQFTFSFG
jgi:hypothetical protein